MGPQWKPWATAVLAFVGVLAAALAIRFGLPPGGASAWILVVVVAVTTFAAVGNAALQRAALSEERRAGILVVGALALFVILFNLAP